MTILAASEASLPMDTSMGSEQRQNPRYLCLERGVLRLCIRPEFRGRRAMMVDISTGGIGFILEESLASGTVLLFELQGANGEATNRIARVRHSRPHPTPPDAPWLPQLPTMSRLFRSLFGAKTPPIENLSWLVGCAFDTPLTEDELKQLVKSLEGPAVEKF